jgi:heme exporter protein A
LGLSGKLEAVGLACVRGDRRLFQGLSFTLEGGELLHVTGPNGAGKTTLLRLLCGLTRPEDGEVRWDGSPVRALGDEYRRRIAYLGHLNAIKDDLTCRENLRYGAALAGAAADEGRLDAALVRMGLSGLDGVPVQVLSQGQKRRTALCRLLVSDCPLWVLDEPFTALDKAAVATVRDAVQAHVAGGGMAVLTTHQEVALDAARTRTLGLGGDRA